LIDEGWYLLYREYSKNHQNALQAIFHIMIVFLIIW